VLLSSAYFPPLSWLALSARDMTLSPDRVLPSLVRLEACENYQKQSYRNRCYILAGDGVQMLQVPVSHRAEEMPISGAFARTGSRSDAEERGIFSVLVDYSTPWIVRTQRALDTAYETSAYYEYYRDELFALLDARPRTLWELNLSTIRFLLDKIGIACELEPTKGFVLPDTEADDYRYALHPKREDSVLANLSLDRPYFQVFRDRMGGFTPRLSALDLLFNEGPDSIGWIKRL
jgi:hypothetical protein